MHVYFYHRGFPPTNDPIHQGVSKAVSGLAGGLVANGASVTVLSELRETGEFVADRGYRVLYFERADTEDPNDQLNFSLAPGLRAYLKQHKTEIDVVIINGMFYKPLTQMGAALRNLAIAYIVAPHDPFHPHLFSSNRLKKLIYWHLFERRMLSGAKAIQVLDERHAQWLHHRGIHRPVIATPNGFDSEDVPELESLSWSHSAEVNLIFLGRIDVQNKGLDLLLEALAQPTLDGNFRLTIQGPDQGGAASLRELAARLGLANRVQIKAPDYSKSSTQIISEHDIFCLPSRFEGFGLAALEAMLSARPMLVSSIAGIAPHVEASDSGVCVQATPESIAEGLTKLLARKDDWQTMGLRGRTYALETLQWNKIAAKALSEYKKVLS